MDFKSFPQIKNSFSTSVKDWSEWCEERERKKEKKEKEENAYNPPAGCIFSPPAVFLYFLPPAPQVVFVFVGFLFYVPAICFVCFLTAHIYFLYFFTAGFF